jgi:hypothetical protein
MSLPTLPPELWLKIFRHATDVPGAFDTSLLPPTSTQARAWTIHPSTFYPSISNKTMLALVCKEWRTVSMELLYESICITSSESSLFALKDFLQSNFEIVSHDNELYHTHYPHIALFTKRLTFDFHTRHFSKWSYIEDECIASIFRLCHNLRIFFAPLRFDGEENEQSLTPSLIQGYCPYLRLFSWLPTHNQRLYSMLIAPAHHVKHLQYLSLSLGDATLYDEQASFPILHTLNLRNDAFPNRELAISDFLDNAIQWDIPKLRAIIVRGALPAGPINFFHRYGLTSLDISHAGWAFDVSPIITSCTSLQTLTAAPYMFCTSLPHHPNLLQIRLRCELGTRAKENRQDFIRSLLLCLARLININCPTLSTIRLIGITHQLLMESSDTFVEPLREQVREWRDKGVRFEYPSGRLLRSPRPIEGKITERSDCLGNPIF